MDTPSLVPDLPQSVRASLARSDNPFVEHVDEIIGKLNELGANLPKRYGWRYRTSEAFVAEIGELPRNDESVFEINKLYWQDMLGTCEAYSIMSTWRVIELARSCIWALARDDNICAALLARAALESAAQFVDAARTINATVCGVTEPAPHRPDD
jgi:hypothetical protein